MTESMPESSDVMALLAQLVVKRRVSLGNMADDERRAALSLAWASLPWGPLKEAEVNGALKVALEQACQCLGTDHVELRRWLVDSGWLARDGYGREYRRLATEAVYRDNLPWAAVWLGRDVAGWVAVQRDGHEARRRQRRQAWEGRPQPGPAGTSPAA